MKISVKAHIADVTKGLSELQKSVVPKAAQMALNRTAPAVKTFTVRALQSTLKLRNQAGLRASIKVSKASKGNLTAEVSTADRSIKMDETRNALVRVTRKRVGKGTRKQTKVIFKGKLLDGAIQIELAPIRSIRKKDGGRYGTGQRSQRVAPVYAYTQLQELIKAEIDKQQEAIGMQRFDKEFDTALAQALRVARF
jgi:hypothetical protein